MSTVRFIIEDVPADCVKLKHQHAEANLCKGNVDDGVCLRCHAQVPGVLGFSFLMDIQDEEYHALAVRDKGLAIEAIEGTTVAAKMLVRYDPQSEDVFMSAFAFAFIPAP